MSRLVRFQELRNVRHQGIIGVGIRQERANGQQDFANGQRWTPLVFQNVETNATIRVDVAVVDTCGKVDFGRLSALQKKNQANDKRENNTDRQSNHTNAQHYQEALMP